MYYIVHGPPKTPAVYELEGKRPTVVFVDDRGSRLPRRSLRTIIGQEVESTLMERNVVRDDEMISSLSALRVASDERYGEAKSISDVGMEVGAEVVVYITIDLFTISRDGVSLSPAAQARVKILDIANSTRLFPGDDAGYPVTVETQTSTSDLPSNRAARNNAERALATQLGIDIAKLFYKHE